MLPRSTLSRSLVLISLTALIISILLSQKSISATALLRRSLAKSSTVGSLWRSSSSSPIVRTMNGTVKHKTPVYFWSHGGPNLIEDTEHPAYKAIQKLGKEITTQVKPKGVVVFSGHWEGEPNAIEINTSEITDLIYDFYGFPPHYYEWKYPHVGSKDLANKVIAYLDEAGIEAEGMRRGLDHGVWASFTCAFNPETNPLNVPIVQASLYSSDDPDKHYKLGQAISRLREEGIVIIVSGQAVHNLRDFFAPGLGPKPYTVSFDNALKEATEGDPEGRQQRMAELLRRPDARRAHPSFDHLLPLYVGAGAAYDEEGKQVFTMHEKSMSWAQYRFGDVSA